MHMINLQDSPRLNIFENDSSKLCVLLYKMLIYKLILKNSRTEKYWNIMHIKKC